MKTTVNRSDENYRDAVNYDGRNYYNFPMTITAKGVKYILSAGSSDMLSIKIKKGLLYVVAENSGLDYISLTVIDYSIAKSVVDELFVGNGELSLNPFNLKRSIFDYSTNYQIRVLSAYM